MHTMPDRLTCAVDNFGHTQKFILNIVPVLSPLIKPSLCQKTAEEWP